MSKALVIFGVGDLPEQVHYYFSEHSGQQVAAFAVEAAFHTTSQFAGLPVLPFDEAQHRFPPATHDLFVAVGYSQFNQVRKRIFLQARSVDYIMPSFVHETACVARNVPIGSNTLLREQAAVSPFVTLGDNIMLGMHTSVSHHVRIENHVWLSADSVVCGGATIGESCFVGANATVRDKVTVGARCIVGAGSLILSDCAADGVYACAPTPRRERA